MEIQEDGNITDAFTVYVGDLSPKTLDSDLFRIFSSIGEVVKIKLIKRVEPFSSFAFVTFSCEEDAKRAIKEYNHFELHKRQIRLSSMVGKNDKSAEGNIIIKNLPDEFTSKDLDTAFSMFGEIVSCKVPTTGEGKTKGYGYVQFAKKKSAKLAIKSCVGTKLGGNVITVELFNPEKKKMSLQSKVASTFTNCFIKNFPSNMTESKLVELLEEYGKVTSIYFPLKSDGASKGFAFANFEDPNAAMEAIKNLHNTYPFGESLDSPNDELITTEPFYIQRGQKKEEREEELRKTFEKLSMQGLNYKRNLYITSIPMDFTKEELISIFKEFGDIVSLSMGKDAINQNKQYAYICYSRPEEATVAVERGNEVFLNGNKLQVAYFKNKQERNKEKDTNSVAYNPNMPYIYNQGVNFSSNEKYSFIKKKNASKKVEAEDTTGKLYDLILSVAFGFKDQWESFGVNSKEEFADKVTKMLYNTKIEENLKSIVKMDLDLFDTIQETIECYKENSGADKEKNNKN